MAYPFPRFGGSPQTPQHVKGIESPRNRMSHSSNGSIAAYKRLIIITVVCTALFLCIINPFSSKPSKQSDRIPFSHELIDECALPKTFTTSELTLCKTATSSTLRVTRIVGSHPRIFTLRLLSMVTMHESPLRIAGIERHCSRL